MGYTIADEVRREDDISKLMVTVNLAAAIASNAVAAATGVGQFGTVFQVTGSALVAPVLLGALALSVPAIARDDSDQGPWEALGDKRVFNRLALATLVIVLLAGAFGGVLVALID